MSQVIAHWSSDTVHRYSNQWTADSEANVLISRPSHLTCLVKSRLTYSVIRLTSPVQLSSEDAQFYHFMILVTWWLIIITICYLNTNYKLMHHVSSCVLSVQPLLMRCQIRLLTNRNWRSEQSSSLFWKMMLPMNRLSSIICARLVDRYIYSCMSLRHKNFYL